MTIQQVEAHLRVRLDAAVERGARVTRGDSGNGKTCGCALQLASGSPWGYGYYAINHFGWSDDQLQSFYRGFDGKPIRPDYDEVNRELYDLGQRLGSDYIDAVNS